MKSINNSQTLSMNGVTVTLSFEVSSSACERPFQDLSPDDIEKLFPDRFHQIQSLAAKKLGEAHRELESAFLFHSCEILSECLESERLNLKVDK